MAHFVGPNGPAADDGHLLGHVQRRRADYPRRICDPSRYGRMGGGRLLAALYDVYAAARTLGRRLWQTARSAGWHADLSDRHRGCPSPA